MRSLDDIAIKHKTDKSTEFHGYTRHYQDLFDKLRNEPISLLEIGIWEGASLRAWEEFFPNAMIYGIDIIDCGKYDTSRITTFQGRQEDLDFLCDVLIKTGMLDIIIDDGSHQGKDQLRSLMLLFPFLNDKGVYAIEDLRLSYDKRFNKGISNSDMITSIKLLIDSVVRSKEGFLDNLESIHFFSNLCVLKKGGAL